MLQGSGQPSGHPGPSPPKGLERGPGRQGAFPRQPAGKRSLQARPLPPSGPSRPAGLGARPGRTRGPTPGGRRPALLRPWVARGPEADPERPPRTGVAPLRPPPLTPPAIRSHPGAGDPAVQLAPGAGSPQPPLKCHFLCEISIDPLVGSFFLIL